MYEGSLSFLCSRNINYGIIYGAGSNKKIIQIYCKTLLKNLAWRAVKLKIDMNDDALVEIEL